MKIAFCPAAGAPSRSAESIFVMKMSETLAKLGHEVTLFIPDTSDRDNSITDIHKHYGIESNFKMVFITLPRIVPLKRVISSLISVIKARWRKTDLLYTRSTYTAFLGVHLGLRTVFEEHSPTLGFIHTRLLRSIVKHKNLARIVVITSALKRYLEKNYSIAPGTILVAPDAADLPTTHERIESIDSHQFQVGYIGHFYPGKGVEIIAELARRCPGMEFHCVGGTEADIEYWANKMRGVENFHLRGYVPFSETEKFRQSFDVLLAPYMRTVNIFGNDGTNVAEWMSPMKIFEYMATRKPIVASDLAVLREVLSHNEDSILCNPDDIGEWEAALTRLQQDSSFSDRIATCAHESFLRKYTWEARASRILASLDSSHQDPVVQ